MEKDNGRIQLLLIIPIYYSSNPLLQIKPTETKKRNFSLKRERCFIFGQSLQAMMGVKGGK